MKIIEEAAVDICIDDLKDGQLAIITQWSGTDKYVGFIVQRWGAHLIAVGRSYGASWSDFFMDDCYGPNYRVRVLAPGTRLEV